METMMVNFILMIEDEFAIEIDFENFNIENLNSLENFTQFITDLKGKTELKNLSV